ncbi:hypothetical protein LZP73_05290 [Shewanella sp. AS16]|uniref:hypothetical protein n=1 Tax=Shewanella sp. AS16 TaxID=2907625 RepID=UPI001F3DA781|nr:hypothetical protein [Shewanella sp. AS16]MCE9685630.1 hypothetical protein [Shewanella sp. AS16]
MKLILASIFIILSMYGSDVYAGTYQGKVTNIYAYGGKIFVRIANGGWDSNSTCTTSTDSFEVWLDPENEYGKALLSIALVSKTADKLVWVAGSGTCIDGPRGKSEGLSGVDLKG